MLLIALFRGLQYTVCLVRKDQKGRKTFPESHSFRLNICNSFCQWNSWTHDEVIEPSPDEFAHLRMATIKVKGSAMPKLDSSKAVATLGLRPSMFCSKMKMTVWRMGSSPKVQMYLGMWTACSIEELLDCSAEKSWLMIATSLRLVGFASK